MKILVLGASGRTGKLIVAEGLSRGHELVGMTRNRNSMQEQSGLTIFEGTPTNANDLAAAAEGCDAILVALNNPREADSPMAKPITTERILTKAAENLIALGDNRVVFLSAIGVGENFETAPWIMRFMIKRTNLKYAYADHDGAEKAFRHSDLRWTLVQPTGLSDKNKEKSLIVSNKDNPKPAMMIRRSTVAKFMLDCAENDWHIRETPVISER